METSVKEAVELQIAEIDLLKAAYPGEDELIIDSSTENVIDSLRDWCFGAGPEICTIPATLSCVLQTRLDTEASDRPSIQLNIEFEMGATAEGTSQHKLPKVQLRQPEWMTKAGVSNIISSLPGDDDAILPIVEYIRDQATIYHNTKFQDEAEHPSDIEKQQLVRVWFYFPSLSTREKRNDLVNHAPEFGLTGFVLAGKPGVLCLEGQSDKVDAYMKFIKTESWGDIPSHHKKVSERYREDSESVQRTFTNMSEITDLLGDKRGERGNRSDMKLLEAWLIDKGLGQAFSHVLM